MSVFIGVLALVTVLWPLAKPGFFISDDGEWMIIRLSAFYQSLADGQFPVRYLGRLNNSYGYPVANFLYPGFLYIGSLFRLMGFSFTDAIKLILGLSVAGSAIAIYFALRDAYRRLPSLLGTLNFIFAPYLLFDLYHRGSVGEILGLFASSLAVLSVIRGWHVLFGLAVGCIIVSHNSVALIMGIAIGALIMASPHRLRMLISGAFGIGMASFFWLPALIEKQFVRFDMVTVSNPLEYFISIGNAELLGITTIVALSIVLGIRSGLRVIDKVVIGIVLFGFVLSVPISAVLWRYPAFASLVQFPYRFLVLPVLFSPWIVAYVFDRLTGWKRMSLLSIFVIVWLLGVIRHIQPIQFVERSEGYYTTNEATTNVANEYMPRWVSEVPIRRPVETLEIIDGDAAFSNRTFSGEQFSVKIDAKEISQLQINKIYYPGWGVTVDNRLVPINYQNPLGVIRVEIPNGVHVVKAEFRETPFRFSADVLSLISFIGFLVSIRRLRKVS